MSGILSRPEAERGQNGCKQPKPDDPQRHDVGESGDRDVVDVNPGEKGARREDDAGDERDDIATHPRPEHPADGHRRSVAC